MSAGVATLLAIAAGALLGSIPFGLIITRLTTGADVRSVGSGNIGATNVLRAGSVLPAILTLLCDAGKGAAAVALARVLVHAQIASGSAGAGLPVGGAAAGAGSTLDDWAGFAAVAGHVFSPWLGFRGGKGVATAAGALAVLSPQVALAALGVFILSVSIFRIVSLGSILACLTAMILAAGPLRSVAPSFPVVLAICALIIARHAANVSRILKGEEPRFGRRGPPRGPA